MVETGHKSTVVITSRCSRWWYVERIGRRSVQRGRRQRGHVNYGAALGFLEPVRDDLLVCRARLEEQVRLVGSLHVAPECAQLGRDSKVAQRTCRDTDMLQFRHHDTVEVGRMIVAAEIATTARDQVGVEPM